MPQIDLKDRFGPRPPILLRQQALQLPVGPVAACDETGRARGQSRRHPHIAHAIAQAGLDGRDRRGLIGTGLRLILRTLIEKWNEVEVEIALAERLQGLAFEIERRRGPERADRIGQQQTPAAAGSSLGFDFSRSMLSPTRKYTSV